MRLLAVIANKNRLVMRLNQTVCEKGPVRAHAVGMISGSYDANVILSMK